MCRRNRGGVGHLLATSFDAGAELPLSLAGAAPNSTGYWIYIKGGSFEVLTPPTSWRCRRARRAPAVLPGWHDYSVTAWEGGAGGCALAIFVHALLREGVGQYALCLAAASRATSTVATMATTPAISGLGRRVWAKKKSCMFGVSYF